MRSGLGAACLVLLPLVSCGGGESRPSQPKDGIEVELAPTQVTPGIETSFTVIVAYSLAGDSTAVINYCWRPRGVDICTCEQDQRIVSPPSGQVGLSHTRALDGPSELVVFLSEWPHPYSWTPLARASVLVTTAP